MNDTSITNVNQQDLALANMLLGNDRDSIPKVPLVKLYQPDKGNFRKNGDELELGSLFVSVRNPDTGQSDKKERIPVPLVGQILSKTAYLSDSKQKGKIQYYTNEILNFNEEVILTKKTQIKGEEKPTYEEMTRGKYREVKDYMKDELNLEPSFIQNIYFYIFASKEVVKIQAKPLSTSAVIGYLDLFDQNSPVSFYKTTIDVEKCGGDFSDYFKLMFTKGELMSPQDATDNITNFGETMAKIKQAKGKNYTEKDMDEVSSANKRIAEVNNEEIKVSDVPF